MHNDVTYIESTPPAARKREGGKDVPGWGADLDPMVRPAVPMERTPPRLEHVHWTEPEPQRNPHHVRVFHSTERPGLSPIYGTTAPPRGLSGLLRSAGYKFSENDIRRWLILLGADRVDMVEGLIEDIAHGHVPNLLKETGARAEWQHNRAGFVRKALVAGAAAGLLVWLVTRDRDARD